MALDPSGVPATDQAVPLWETEQASPTMTLQKLSWPIGTQHIVIKQADVMPGVTAIAVVSSVCCQIAIYASWAVLHTSSGVHQLPEMSQSQRHQKRTSGLCGANYPQLCQVWQPQHTTVSHSNLEVASIM